VVPDVRRIAVVRCNAIGDFVLALPALDALRATYPNAEITYLGSPWHDRLLPGRPGPWNRVRVVPPYPGLHGAPASAPQSPDLAAFLTEERRYGYDLAFQLHGGGGQSNPLVEGLGARVSVGARDRDAPPLDRWTPYVRHQHEILRLLEVVALAGAPPVTLDPRFRVTPGDRRAAALALGSLTGPGAAPESDGVHLVAVHPGATDPRRRWSPERFAAVADTLADHGARVVLVGTGPDDARSAARIRAAMRRPAVDAVDRLELPALVGLLARCRLLVGNDSGPRHLAGAVGTATVAVYWAGNAINASPPTGSRHRIAVSFRSACPVCGREQGSTRCPHDPSFVDDVPVDEVTGYALDLFHGRGFAPQGTGYSARQPVGSPRQDGLPRSVSRQP
jgi:ADP-heptose:LPS heptosyltransferase